MIQMSSKQQKSQQQHPFCSLSRDALSDLMLSDVVRSNPRALSLVLGVIDTDGDGNIATEEAAAAIRAAAAESAAGAGLHRPHRV